ncbi:unnamed protein product [Chondrus crispus]|uniref:Uncharacterized protein n=1 Tax=Chondrus crispus TaxID=2769 RepID=R7QU78_CHOCR|nr:unnamed protein product [Chondrus crispus]CDF40910.1 unnamed protein product [Chondrus crispus]|eukprot:XP_005711204.1 unnamed protein product [Chondrus crispus]
MRRGRVQPTIGWTRPEANVACHQWECTLRAAQTPVPQLSTHVIQEWSRSLHWLPSKAWPYDDGKVVNCRISSGNREMHLCCFASRKAMKNRNPGVVHIACRRPYAYACHEMSYASID